MDKMTASRITGGNTSFSRSAADFYPTPDDVTEALIWAIKPEPETAVIWEPACGDGRMLRCLERFGPYQAVGTDILTGDDFLSMGLPEGCNWIITNPPFSQAEAFIRHAYALNVPFAFLLKSQFWHAKKRYELFMDCNPDYIFPLTWRPDFLFKERGGSSLMDVAWNVWLRRDCAHNTVYMPLERPKKETE